MNMSGNLFSLFRVAQGMETSAATGVSNRDLCECVAAVAA
jgi:hypothetical protein